MSTEPPLVSYPLTPERWADLEILFGPEGAFMGCWCAYWRMRHKDFGETRAGDHRALLYDRVCSGFPPGLLGYLDGEPVAWVSVEPRNHFAAFEHARVYTAVDDTPVWTVSCFYLREDVRGQGLTTDLLRAVKSHVRARRDGGRGLPGRSGRPRGERDTRVHGLRPGVRARRLRGSRPTVERPAGISRGP